MAAKSGGRKPRPKATVVRRGDGTTARITTSRYAGGGDTGALAPRPGEYQAGRKTKKK